MNGHSLSSRCQRLEELLVESRTRDLDAAERDELNALLRTDPGMRTHAARFLLDDVALAEELRTLQVEALMREQPGMMAGSSLQRVRTPRWLAWFAWRPLATAAIGILGAVWLGWASTRVNKPIDFVSTLVFADGCEWLMPGKLREGQRLAAGTLRLRRGMAVLRFDGGAAVVVTGETDVVLQSRSSALLRRGTVVVQAADGAAGFVLQTPASDVLDLGTEFAAKVEPSGATELHVLEGQVSYRKPATGGRSEDEPSGELLSAGNAVRYDRPGAATPRSVALNATSFEQLIQQVKPAAETGSLIAYEPFDYPVGRLPLRQANGGIGWAGPWQMAPWCEVIHPGPARDFSIAVNPFQMRTSESREPHVLLEAMDGFQSALRRFTRPVRLDRDGVYFLSGVVRWETGGDQIVPGLQLRIMLRASSDLMGEHLMLNLPSHLHPQVQRRVNEIHTSASTVGVNQTQLWVAKIVAQQNGEDEVHFRIYGEAEVPGSMEPATWHLSVRGIRSDIKFDTLGLSTYFGSGRYWFGEVRLGTSWRAVVPVPQMAAARDSGPNM